MDNEELNELNGIHELDSRFLFDFADLLDDMLEDCMVTPIAADKFQDFLLDLRSRLAHANQMVANQLQAHIRRGSE